MSCGMHTPDHCLPPTQQQAKSTILKHTVTPRRRNAAASASPLQSMSLCEGHIWYAEAHCCVTKHKRARLHHGSVQNPTALGHSHQGPAITQHLHVSHPQKQCDTAPQTTTQGSSRSQRSCSIPADPPQQLGTQVKYVCTRRHARSSKPHSPAGLAVYESHNLT